MIFARKYFEGYRLLFVLQIIWQQIKKKLTSKIFAGPVILTVFSTRRVNLLFVSLTIFSVIHRVINFQNLLLQF